SSMSLSFLHPSPTSLSSLSLHDALPIYVGAVTGSGHHTGWSSPSHRRGARRPLDRRRLNDGGSPSSSAGGDPPWCVGRCRSGDGDRKSTRLNSSHVSISYAVFCLKKKRK